MDIIAPKSQNKSFTLNTRMTEVMIVAKKQCVAKCDIIVNGTSFNQINMFMYLNTVITADGKKKG